MNSKKVIISAFSNLYTDQRIEKVCQTLFENGYTIELIGNDWNGAERMERPYAFSRIHLQSKSLKTAYFEFNWKLFRQLKKKSDLHTILYANDIDALLPNYLIARMLNIPLIFDSHEIFSEMPAIQGKISQKFWRYLERKLIPKIQLMITASGSYAEWFHKKYGANPIVIQNAPQRSDYIPQIVENNPKIILYQGYINPFRGIDKAILAMHQIEGAILKIAGNGPKKKEYEELVIRENLQHKVRFLGKLDPKDLKKITVIADVGISIEENGGDSYLYSLPNKVLDYIQARIPLVMANLPEMQNISQQFQIGKIICNHDPEEISKAISHVLQNGKEYYLTELEKAAQAFCWENEEKKLLQVFQRVSQ
ncbi:glycosyltransferase [Chryseobacterium sp.]|uniref:glycosyltransferase n=1 Tax=Chryseobacterium sp. TaxID=1871047 RepID=UPI0025BD18F2|nr:glycosyltransferase [Chryseobacterium sp.]